MATGFPASTKIHTPDGLVALGDLRVGDLVRSTDVATGESGDWPVLETHVIPGVRLATLNWFDGERESWFLTGPAQRFWVTTDEPEERFRIPREGPPPTGWRPAEGPKSEQGSLRGWVEVTDLWVGDQWIVAATSWAAAGYYNRARIVQTDRERVAWAEPYPDASEGQELDFDADGRVTAIRSMIPVNPEFETPFTAPTRQLTVDRGHSFHVLDVGLVAADHVNDGGALMATPPAQPS